MKIGARPDEADLGFERLWRDEIAKGDIAQIELPPRAHHVAVEPLLDERAVGADPQLAAEHDVESVRRSAARLRTRAATR